MAKLGRDGTAGSTGGSRAFINSAKRVRKNTNAVSDVAKKATVSPSSVKKTAITETQAKTNTIRKNSVQVKQKGFEVEIQGKMYKTGGPAEKKMAELRKLQTANTVAKRATAPKRMK